MKSLAKKPALSGYAPFLSAVKNRIRAAQVKATLAANAELIHLYWDIGRAIAAMQAKEGWGAGVIPRLARDIANDLPEVKGFSERNMGRMIAFAREYPGMKKFLPRATARLAEPPQGQPPVAQLPGSSMLPPPVAKFPVAEILPPLVAKLAVEDDLGILQRLAAQIPWTHQVMLMEKIKDLRARRWYVEQTITHGWSRSVLALQISSRAHEHRGQAVHNFHATVPPPQSDLDLLFYHLRLRCFVVVDLKRGPFKAEYAGKMNLYCSVVDDRLRHADDQPTVGLILCQDKNRIVAEYALKGVKKSIGVSEYQLTRTLPKKFQSSLPTVEQMETELARLIAPRKSKPRMTRMRRMRRFPSVKSVVKTGGALP